MKTKTETIINTSAMALIAAGTGLIADGEYIGAVLVIIGGLLEFVKYWLRNQD